MSIEWYICAFKNKNEQYVPTDKILEIFSNYKIKKFTDYIEIDFGYDIVAVFFELTEDKITNLMISRPILNDELKKLLYRIMKLGNFILYSPDGIYPIMVAKDIEKEFPDDMIEVLGDPKIAETEKEFVLLLNKGFT